MIPCFLQMARIKRTPRHLLKDDNEWMRSCYVKLQRRRIFACSVCTFASLCKSKWQKHVSKHPGAKKDPTACALTGKFVCPCKDVNGCDFVTARVQMLSDHMVDDHGFIRCDNFWCTHVFQYADMKERHMGTHHSTDVVIIDWFLYVFLHSIWALRSDMLSLSSDCLTELRYQDCCVCVPCSLWWTILSCHLVFMTIDVLSLSWCCQLRFFVCLHDTFAQVCFLPCRSWISRCKIYLTFSHIILLVFMQQHLITKLRWFVLWCCLPAVSCGISNGKGKEKQRVCMFFLSASEKRKKYFSFTNAWNNCCSLTCTQTCSIWMVTVTLVTSNLSKVFLLFHNKSCSFTYMKPTCFVSCIPAVRTMSAEEYFAALALSKMCSTQETLLLMGAYYADVLTEVWPHEKYDRFDLDNFTNAQCRALFRFEHEHVIELSELLCLPEYWSETNLPWTAVEGTALLLRRLSYPGCLEDLAPHFGRSPSECSTIFNHMLADIHHRHSRHLNCLTQPWLDPDRYAAAIVNKGSPVENVWGFVDGMLVHICRPGTDQREMFSGHKQRHGVKFQHVMAPNGIVVNSFGPYPGSHHDAAMLRSQWFGTSTACDYTSKWWESAGHLWGRCIPSPSLAHDTFPWPPTDATTASVQPNTQSIAHMCWMGLRKIVHILQLLELLRQFETDAPTNQPLRDSWYSAHELPYLHVWFRNESVLRSGSPPFGHLPGVILQLWQGNPHFILWFLVVSCNFAQAFLWWRNTCVMFVISFISNCRTCRQKECRAFIVAQRR